MLPVDTIFIRANGLIFEVLTCGTGPRLALCLHGFPEVGSSWLHQMQTLAELGFRVWAPSQRGYGHTTRPPAMRSYSIEHLMADVAALIDSSGATETVLLGHDWGAVVAWCFATRQLRPLIRLVVVNVPHPACYARALRRHPGQWLRSWYAAAFQLPWLPECWLARNGARAIPASILRSSTHPDSFPRDLLESTRQNAAEPGALKAMIDWYRAAGRGGGLRRQLRQGFPVIEAPTLVLWGEADPFLGVYTLEHTEQYVARLTVVRLPGVSHWVQQDAPERMDRELRAFLAPSPPVASA